MLDTKQVRGDLYQVSGGVGNAFFYVGKSETLIIDGTKSSETGKALLEEAAKVSEKPVRRVVLTHSDGDHINGLSAFPAGVTIISHPNTRQDIIDANISAEVKQPLPSVTFEEKLTVHVDDRIVELLHFGPAHTSADVVVLLPAEKVAITGDLVMLGRDPLIHKHKNGSSFGLVRVLKAVLDLDADLYASGHCDPVGREQVQELIARIEDTQSRVRAMVDEGLDLDDVRRKFSILAGGRWIPLPEVIYGELTAD